MRHAKKTTTATSTAAPGPTDEPFGPTTPSAGPGGSEDIELVLSDTVDAAPSQHWLLLLGGCAGLGFVALLVTRREVPPLAEHSMEMGNRLPIEIES